ncbi:hypothetical protein CU669_05505 [Paramagnetospirillum kuznetsovii]|uniref:Cobalt ABC transporter permease n=1 Tax=Paramagnetospirillum kuznetsovii TaxID=2053833 RepID=A0A364P0L2_9PROT|nr:hypothetical protein [Paramagnetospirillum kuznetsovii]RAU22843.1 hypothetical protein CU669_05505 [Paramagnetospirillum kuznetsovii]
MIKTLALLLVLLLLAHPAQAHKLKVFASAEGAAISGLVYFSGGAKAMGVSGVVQGPDGAEVGRFATAEDGSFRFPVNVRMDHLIMVDAGDGHVASALVAADEFPASLPPTSLPQVAASARSAPTVASVAAAADMDAVEAAVARQIRPLRQQLDAYEEKVRLHDLLGGIGTIFGLFGIVAWLNARGRTS